MFIAELLVRHFGRKVILLIDEYDVPLDKAFQEGYCCKVEESFPETGGGNDLKNRLEMSAGSKRKLPRGK